MRLEEALDVLDALLRVGGQKLPATEPWGAAAPRGCTASSTNSMPRGIVRGGRCAGGDDRRHTCRAAEPNRAGYVVTARGNWPKPNMRYVASWSTRAPR